MRGVNRLGVGAGLGLLAVAGGCRSAAAVFLDLPPQTERTQALAQAPARDQAPIVQDTVRPPIESTLDPDSALAMLPRDGGGNVDWVAAIRQGVVQPRRSLPGQREPAGGAPFAFDFFLEGPDPMFDALFPHSGHTLWLDCRGCHPSIYRYRGHTTSMAEIGQGESCGQCHGPVAFSTTACYRCHTAMPPSGQAEPTLSGEIEFARDSATAAASGGFPTARFPHWLHRIRYACTACHPGLFRMRAGANEMSMASMQAGESCGACHNQQSAFSIVECGRCHVPSEPDEDP